MTMNNCQSCSGPIDPALQDKLTKNKLMKVLRVNSVGHILNAIASELGQSAANDFVRLVTQKQKPKDPAKLIAFFEQIDTPVAATCLDLLKQEEAS